MTGLECLREEMKKRGCNNSQLNSKVIGIVLDIISGNENLYINIQEAKQELADERNTLSALRLAKDNLRWECKYLEEEIKMHESDYLEKCNEIKKYIDDFNKSLTECETAEGRDALRRAQVFTNSVEVNTVYDNTAYIKGLGAILSNGEVGYLDEIKAVKAPEKAPLRNGSRNMVGKRKYKILGEI